MSDEMYYKGKYLTKAFLNENDDPSIANFKNKSNKYPMKTLNSQVEAEKTGYTMLQKNDSILIDTRYNIFGKEKTDSDKMVHVKDELRHLNNFYRTEMSMNNAEFENQLGIALGYYNTLIKACNEYLHARRKKKNKSIDTVAGRRYQLVKQTRETAIKELSQFTNYAKQIFDDSKNENNTGSRPLWLNVLIGVRTVELNLAETKNVKVEKTGGETSEVLKVTLGNGQNQKVGYIKEDKQLINHKNFKMAYCNTLKTNIKSDTGKIIDTIDTNCIGDNYRDTFKAALGKEGLSLAPTDIINNKTKYLNCLKNFLEKQYQGDICRKKNFDEIAINYSVSYLKNYFAHDIALKKVNISDQNLYLSKRNVASSKIADLLGIGDIIAGAKKIQYTTDDGNTHKGIMLQEAKGISLTSLEEQIKAENNNGEKITINYSPKALLQINSLNFFDRLVGQIDRNTGNIFVEYDNKTHTVKQIMGIDNDMCFGTTKFIPETTILKEIAKAAEDNKKIQILTLSHIDAKLYNSVMSLSPEILRAAVADLLVDSEIKALEARFTQLQEQVKNSVKRNSLLPVNNDSLTDTRKSNVIATNIKCQDEATYYHVLFEIKSKDKEQNGE